MYIYIYIHIYTHTHTKCWATWQEHKMQKRNDLIQGLHTIHFPVWISLYQTHFLLTEIDIFYVEYSMNHFRHTHIESQAESQGNTLSQFLTNSNQRNLWEWLWSSWDKYPSVKKFKRGGGLQLVLPKSQNMTNDASPFTRRKVERRMKGWSNFQFFFPLFSAANWE